jgi:hypothetical protein
VNVKLQHDVIIVQLLFRLAVGNHAETTTKGYRRASRIKKAHQK